MTDYIKPAFPVDPEVVINHDHEWCGMTLRDYFAGQALAGGLEQGVEDDMNLDWWHNTHKIAKRAYAIADAMMKARDDHD
jgi:hypothetical protein